MGNTSDKWSGKAKKMAGKISDDKEMEAKGKAQEQVGKIKGKLD